MLSVTKLLKFLISILILFSADKTMLVQSVSRNMQAKEKHIRFMEIKMSSLDNRRRVTINFEINDSVITIITRSSNHYNPKVLPIYVLVIKFEVLSKSRILNPRV